MSDLAVHGGKPVREKLFPSYNPIGQEELAAAQRVIASGNLSQYIGAWHADFHGGPEVRSFESQWAAAYGVEHALAVNSATSGLFAAVGACGVGPGDEVVVSPFTMSATAMAVAAYGAVPVFADIGEEDFCINAVTIAERLTRRTKAILVVHIFGHPADMDPILELAAAHRLRVIEDCAQAPMARYKGRYVGTIGDVGVFSLNYHKHVHTGEGGVVTTRDAEVAERVALIRNHAESVVEGMGREDLAHLIGFNYRLTEVQAAIGSEQLKKVPGLVAERVRNAEYLAERMGRLPGLKPARARAGCEHVYYVQPAIFDASVVGVHRDEFVRAVRAELPTARMRETVPLVSGGYVRPLYLLPFFQTGSATCSYRCPRYEGHVSYARGLCPVAERKHYHEIVTHEFMRPGMSRADLDDVVRGFEKVMTLRDELKADA